MKRDSESGVGYIRMLYCFVAATAESVQSASMRQILCQRFFSSEHQLYL